MMREEFVELSKKYDKLKYKDLVKFKKKVELRNSFNRENKSPMILFFSIFIGLDVLAILFLPMILKIIISAFIVYLICLMFDFQIYINNNKETLTTKKFIFKKTIPIKEIRRIYYITGKKDGLGGIRGKIKIIYKKGKGENIYGLDTMFVKKEDLGRFLNNIQVEPLTDEEEKNGFDKKNIIDNTLFEFIDFCFLVPIALCIIIDLFLV